MEMEVSRTDLGSFSDEQSPIAMKKLALRDVQNDDSDHSTKSCSLGPPTVEGKKVLGIKRPKPESSPNHPRHPSLTEKEVNEHLVNGDRNVDKEITKRRSKEHKNTSYAPVVASFPSASPMTFTPGMPSIPLSLEKPDSGVVVVDSDHLNVTTGSEVPYFITDNEKYDHQLFQLQNLLKHCAESDQINHVRVFISA